MGEITKLPTPKVPQSVEAEQAVLGAILTGQSAAEVQAVGGGDIFYDPVHAMIFQACRALEKQDKLVSPITVKATMSPQLEESLKPIGGPAYLARLAGAAIAPSQIRAYASLIAEAHAKRHLMDVMRDAHSALESGDHSASDVAARMEAGFQALEHGESRVKPVSMMSAITEVFEDIKAVQDGVDLPTVRPGIIALERLVPGFAPGELWLLGGRPSMGKTACALSMGLNAARAGHSVVIASLEMTPKAMAFRALSEGTAREKLATSYSNIRSGQYSEGQLESIKAAGRKTAELPITFLPRQYQDADLLQVGVKQAFRHMNTDRPPLVIVDYAQLMRSKSATRYEQITDVSLALKGMAMSLNVPVIALSQLSRALESRDDKRPMLSDLRESGQLEQDADGVMFCFRHEYYLEREEPSMDEPDKYADWLSAKRAVENHLEIIVAKQRQGQIGTAKVRFNPALNLIWEDRR